MAFDNGFLNRMPPVTKNLLIVNILIFVVMAVMPPAKEALVDRYLGLHYFSSPTFNIAQPFTYMFIHAGFMHLFFNMFALIMFGPQIEWSLGSKRFLFYYISCGIGAALIQEGVFALMLTKYTAMFPPEQFDQIIREGARALSQGMDFSDPTMSTINRLVNGGTVGASGAIYGVLLAFGMLFPNYQLMLIIPPMPVKAKWLVVGYAVIELVYGVGGSSSGVAHFCHLGGMVAGLLIILYWKHKGLFRRY